MLVFPPLHPFPLPQLPDLVQLLFDTSLDHFPRTCGEGGVLARQVIPVVLHKVQVTVYVQIHRNNEISLSKDHLRLPERIVKECCKETEKPCMPYTKEREREREGVRKGYWCSTIIVQWYAYIQIVLKWVETYNVLRLTAE